MYWYTFIADRMTKMKTRRPMSAHSILRVSFITTKKTMDTKKRVEISLITLNAIGEIELE